MASEIAEMTYEKLQYIIQQIGGTDKIIGFIFNNVSKKIFKQGEFDKIISFIPDHELIVITEKDMYDKEYKVYKPIITIEAVLTTDDAELVGKFDPRYMG